MANISSINGNPIVVGASGIEDGSVTGPKVADGSIGPEKLSSDLLASIPPSSTQYGLAQQHYEKVNLLRRGISRTTGGLTSASNRACSGIYEMTEGDYFALQDGYEGWIAYYDKNDSLINNKAFTFYDWSFDEYGWQRSAVPVKRSGPCALVVHRTDDGVIEPSTLNGGYGKIAAVVRNSSGGVEAGGFHWYVMNVRTTVGSNSGSVLQRGGLGAWDDNTIDIDVPRYYATVPVKVCKGLRYYVDDGYLINVLRFPDDGNDIATLQCKQYTTDEDFVGALVIRPIDNNARYFDYSPADVFHVEYIGEFDTTGWEQLPMGEFVQGGMNANGSLASRNDRISMADTIALPRSTPLELRVSIAAGYKLGIRVGAKADGISSNNFWFANGDTIELPAGHNYFKVSIANTDGMTWSNTALNTNAITPSDYYDAKPKLWYRALGQSSIGKQDGLVNAAKMVYGSGVNSSLYDMPVIAHTSDCHGDYARVKRFLDYSDMINVDLAAITGDIVSYNVSHGIGWFHELVNGHRSLVGVCTGNHDVLGATGTDDDTYSFFYEPIAEAIGNETGKTWYSTDIKAKSLRVISINLYQREGTTNNHTHFTQEQLSWLCSTLASTPAGYGVVLLYHSPQRGMSAASEGYEKFFQTLRKYNNTYNDVQGSPINDIVDAFISRGSINKTYEQTGTPATVSVAQDFSGVADGVEFIAHLTGHFHQDSIAYVTGTEQMQLMLNVICTNAIYGGSAYPYLCDLADTPRNAADGTQDAFNVYVIDREAKTVKVVRVGSELTFDMQHRDYMEIPYAEQ